MKISIFSNYTYLSEPFFNSTTQVTDWYFWNSVSFSYQFVEINMGSQLFYYLGFNSIISF